jgi:glycosyltransferase involved in cell wall biosynthesis
MKKKILIFSLSYYPFVGGAEIAEKEITDRISSDEFDFDMITLRYDKSLPKFEKIGNVNVYRIGWGKTRPTMNDLVKFPMYLNKIFFPATAFLKAWSLDRSLPRGQKYDALWCMMSYTGFSALFLNWFKRKIPIILTLQEGDSISHITGRLRIKIVFPIYKAIFKKASVVQVISTFLGQFAKDMGYDREVEVIPNAVDTKIFSTKVSADTLNDLKEKFSKKEGDVFLITTSRLVPKNGVADVIEALTYLPENYKFLVLGVGPLEDELEAQVKKLGLENQVKFLGQIGYSEIPQYLQISDIFIRPSLSEGMGNSFIEAMAAGVPVVATAVGGITDFLHDRWTGVVCKVNDPKDVAEKVKLLATDAALREHIIRQAEKLVFEKYDWNLIAKDMKERVFLRVS